MAHVHIIVDHDKHFIIDPITKKIQPENPEKNKLVRYDHNSERYTFEMDRMLEGHDMSLCDIVQIHYINVSSNKQKKNEDIYEVNDLGLLSGNEDRIAFTWLVSRNATMLDGILTFAIRFACSNGDSIDYELHTEIFSSISISNTIINNGQSIVEEYSDILNQWKKELFGIEGTIQTAKRESLAAIDKNRTDSLNAINSDSRKAIDAINFARESSLEAIDRYGLVQVSEEDPTNPNVDMHINPNTTESFTVPEIIDDSIGPEDTWSSEKINTELSKVNTDVTALKEDLTHKADAIVETASGETIQVEDSSGLGFEGLRIFGKSTQDGVPTPESPVPIVGAGDKGTIEVEVTGTNLFDVSKIEDTWNGSYGIKNNNGVLEMVSSSNDSTISSNKTLKELCPQVKVGETYVFSAINSGTRKEIYLYNTGVVEYGKPIVATNEVLNSKLRFYLSNKINDSGIIHNIQVNKGDTVLPYEPYRIPQTLALSTPNGLPGIKVDKDGNYTDKNGQQWICDEIDLARGKYVQRVRNAVLNSSLGQLSVGVHGNGVHYLGVSLKVRPKMNSLGMCERYKGNERWTDKNGYVYIPSNRSIIITDNRFTDIDSAKRIIDTEQAKLLYIMDTPIEHDLTPEEITAYKTLHTNYPTTVVSNDESAHMEVSYVADTKNYIASKIETPLQKQITDLQNALISQKISGGGYKSN